ncbi:MAG: DUF4838 domain-containing protein [Clostridiaceae bacterium]|nr:DUF4838 domain-containing protein [Clostridiaceae bacterium]
MQTKENHLIVENGQTKWRIIISRSAAPAEIRAAQELQRFLLESTGVCLAIEDDQTPVEPFEILVGPGNHATALFPLADPESGQEALTGERFTIRTANDSLLILGGSPRGTLYGVYSFLEKYLGCRWFTPTVDKIPRRSRLELPDINIVGQPSLDYRDLYCFDVFDQDWLVRNKINGHTQKLDPEHGGNISYAHFVHTFDQLVPAGEYFAEHPEYFSEVDGHRLSEKTQLCLTNPEVAVIAIKQVRQWLKDEPDARIVSVSQNDCYNPCQCESCRRLDQEEGSHSGTLIYFVNQIARAVAAEFPDVLIDTLAYQYTRKPPRHIKPEPNVVVRLCSIECCFSHPLEECREISFPFNLSGRPDTIFADDLAGWSKISKQLYIWDYVTNFNHYLMPFPNLPVFQPNIQFFIKNQVKGIFEQGNGQSAGGDFSELKAYVLAKLLWDERCDVDAVINDFLAGCYSHAAVWIRRYLDLFWQETARSKVHAGIYDSPDKNRLSAAFLEQASDCFDRAEQAADDPEILKRVKKLRLPLLYVQLFALPDEQPDRQRRQISFMNDLQSLGVQRISEAMDMDVCRRQLDQGLSFRQIEKRRMESL